MVCLLLRLALDGRARVLPSLPAAGQRVDVGVAHALEVVAGQGRAVAAAAVEDELRSVIRDGGLYIALDDAAPQVLRACGVAALPLVVFAHVDEARALADALKGLLDIDLADARFGVLHQLQESFGVLHTGRRASSRFDFRFGGLL